MSHSPTDSLGLWLIPEPAKVKRTGEIFRIAGAMSVALPADCSEPERFAADYFARAVGRDLSLQVQVTEGTGKAPGAVRFERDGSLGPQAYRLSISSASLCIQYSDSAGAYYGTQTLRQCLRRVGDEVLSPGVLIDDAPDLKYRASHWDTKHHQPTAAYVQSFIEELAHYKVNVLVWEWEDKLAYRKHPEVGAPGAFTIEQMQEFTHLARRHHMELVPLVQGLGHVSFILKHPRFRHLREVADSNWEFCPLKEGTYQLLFDLWEEAMEATPGSRFFHIGSDETYELGEGEACGCKVRAAEIGNDGLAQIFIRRCTEHLASKGRTVLSWGGAWKPGSPHLPHPSMIFADSADVDYLLAARQAGYPGWIYAPNPGITPLMIPCFATVIHSLWHSQAGKARGGAFAQTAAVFGRAAREKACEGSIATTWDDSGLHQQCWMPRLICAAEFSWNGSERDINQWAHGFFVNYFGPDAKDLPELFVILQESAQFYDDTFERRVWHWGDIGKIHLPDFPRGDLEISNYWRGRYHHLVALAMREAQKLDRALAIIDNNLGRAIRHGYDLQVMRTGARLMRHNANVILMLAQLESELCEAHALHYRDRRQSLAHLKKMEQVIEENLRERQEVFTELVSVWEKTRLPKGLSLPGKPFVFARDRARHFANRTPDMTYLILDEQKLDLEGYLQRLKAYNADYEKNLQAQAPAVDER
jgi:hypothetical protein